MNAIFIIFAIIYAVGIVLISLKLADIIKNPNKYEDRELVQKAMKIQSERDYFRFFQSLSHQYGCIVFIPSFLAFLGITYLILISIHRIMAGDLELILLGGSMAGLSPMLFLGITLLFVIFLLIKTPFFAIASDNAICGGGRARNFKVGFISLLVSFVLLFPFYGLSINCYVHFDENGISSSKYFELDETYTPFEDVVHAKIWLSHEGDGDPGAVYYQVTLPGNRIIDIASVNTRVTDETVRFHSLLLQKGNCEFEITPLTKEDWDWLEEHASVEKLEMIEYIFGVSE